LHDWQVRVQPDAAISALLTTPVVRGHTLPHRKFGHYQGSCPNIAALNLWNWIMAKFVQVPVEEKPPEVATTIEVAESNWWHDPLVHQAFAVFVIAVLATIFIAMMVRGLFIRSSRPKAKPAALSGAGYSGKGFGNKKPAESKATLRRP
jgi:hypothetical protein